LLLARGVTKAEIEIVEKEASQVIAAAVDAAMAAPWPAISAGYADIQTAGAQL
jgi:hypothetical protein